MMTRDEEIRVQQQCLRFAQTMKQRKRAMDRLTELGVGPYAAIDGVPAKMECACPVDATNAEKP